MEELLGTKLRALYQRKKGRDLFDLWQSLTMAKIDTSLVIKCYYDYMAFSLEKSSIPSKNEFLLNLENKRNDSEFQGDTIGLLRSTQIYNQDEAFELVIKELIEFL